MHLFVHLLVYNKQLFLPLIKEFTVGCLNGIYLSSIRGGIPCIPYYWRSWNSNNVLNEHGVGTNDEKLCFNTDYRMTEH